MTTKTFACLLAVVALSIAALAQGPPAPKPSPDLEKLSKTMVGRWNIDAKFESSDMMPGGGTSKGTAVIKEGPGGMSLVQTVETTGTTGKFSGMGLTWWSEKENAFKSVWCDSMSPGCMVSNGSSKWEGKEIKGSDTMEMMGKKYVVHNGMSDITPRSFTYYEDAAPEGQQPKRAMTIKYTRATAAKGRDNVSSKEKAH